MITSQPSHWYKMLDHKHSDDVKKLSLKKRKGATDQRSEVGFKKRHFKL